ncbi:hypothetical protein FQR65_LT01478 [Abscondita terminalis]|nr:hypothetical protein FQR65_LT01478 [Abscondita terminalis]
MSSIVHILEKDVEKLWNWDRIFEALETAMKGLSKGSASQGSNSATSIGCQSFMVLLPGYINHEIHGGLSCKLYTVKPNSEETYVLFLNPETGAMRAIIQGNLFTWWRTAAASLIAAKHLHGVNSGKPNKILAICGAGNQGRSHALAFQHFFKFEEIRIWNRTSQRAKDLVEQLNKEMNSQAFVAANSVESCVKNADMIVCATPGNETIVRFPWIKPGAHVTAIGVFPNRFELDTDIYKRGKVYVDSMTNAKKKLKHIEDLGVEFQGEIGDVINEAPCTTDLNTITVFQSLGMGVEDCAVARVIYDAYMKNRL